MARQVASKLCWDEKNRRWTIKYRGRSFSVSVRQLRGRECNVGDSKSGSVAAAARWWEEKRCAADNDRVARQGIESAIANAVEQRQRNLRIGNQADAQFWKQFGDSLQRLTHEPSSADIDFDPDSGRFDGAADSAASPVILTAMAKLLSMLQADKQNAIVFAERKGLPLTDKPQAPATDTLGQLAEAYKASRRAEVDRGNLSADQFGLIVRCLKHFADFVGNDLPASAIDEQAIEGYRRHTLTGRSRPTSRNGAKREKIGKLWSSSFVRKFFVVVQ